MLGLVTLHDKTPVWVLYRHRASDRPQLRRIPSAKLWKRSPPLLDHYHGGDLMPRWN